MVSHLKVLTVNHHLKASVDNRPKVSVDNHPKISMVRHYKGLLTLTDQMATPLTHHNFQRESLHKAVVVAHLEITPVLFSLDASRRLLSHLCINFLLLSWAIHLSLKYHVVFSFFFSVVLNSYSLQMAFLPSIPISLNFQIFSTVKSCAYVWRDSSNRSFGIEIYGFLINCSKPSMDIDLGRSSGRPSARSQIYWVKPPMALDTPKITV